MTDKLARRVRNLQEARDLDTIDETAYQQALTRLRAQYGDAAITAQLQQPAQPESSLPPAAASSDQQIHNTAPNQGAQGIFYGSVFISGQRGTSATEVLAAYLQRQQQRCGHVSLQRMYQLNH